MHPKHPCSSCAPCTADLRKRNLHSSAVSHKWHGCLAGILGESQSNKSEFLLLPSSSAMSKSMAFSMLWIVSGSSWDKFLKIWQKMVRWWSMEISSASKCNQGTSSETKQSAELLPQIFCPSTTVRQRFAVFLQFHSPKHPWCAAWLLASSWLLPHLQSLLASMIASPFLGCHDPQPARQNGHCHDAQPKKSTGWLQGPILCIQDSLRTSDGSKACRCKEMATTLPIFWEHFQSENPPPLPSQVQCQPRPNFWEETKISVKSRNPPQFLSRNWGNSPTKGAVPGAICRQKPWTTSASWIGQNRNGAAAKKPFRLPLLHFVGTVHIAGRFRCLRNPQWRGKCPRFTEIKIISRSRCHASTMQIYERGCQSNIITHRQHEMTASIEHHWFCCTKNRCLTVPHGWLDRLGLAGASSSLSCDQTKHHGWSWAKRATSITSKAFKVTFVGCIGLPHIANLLRISRKQTGLSEVCGQVNALCCCGLSKPKVNKSKWERLGGETKSSKIPLIWKPISINKHLL